MEENVIQLTVYLSEGFSIVLIFSTAIMLVFVCFDNLDKIVTHMIIYNERQPTTSAIP